MESLPIELLRRIAFYSPYPSLHSLVCVSRKLRRAFHDWLVYKQIIDNHLHGYFRLEDEKQEGEPDFLPSTGRIAVWARNPIDSNTPPELCAKYAFADYRCFILKRNPFFEKEDLIEDFAWWAGPMVARGHPATQLLERALKVSQEDIGSPTVNYIITFCLTSYLLSHTKNKIYERAHLIAPADVYSVHWKVIHEQWGTIREILNSKASHVEVKQVGNTRRASMKKWREMAFEGTRLPTNRAEIDGTDMLVPWRMRTVRDCTAFSMHELCMRSVGMMGQEYRGDVKKVTWRAMGYTPAPSGYEIPFEKFMKLPEPFAEPAEFVGCHLEKMMTKEFIEQGRWVGIYSYWRPNSLSGMSMTKVKFRVILNGNAGGGGQNGVDEGHGSVETIRVTGCGEDGAGSFVLHGRMSPNTGKMFLVKAYSDHDVFWDWLLFMTPFGLVGSCGARAHSELVWLWKEDWYTDAQVNMLGGKLLNTL
ncbi:hypothetical protein H072_3426 [Dactylellina haptotyla CBS 200.50]|uniref:F-box domain-containing protein n=1 Tax=Dactylellina haptotyla (strain CBS 200.50) TaxID=1284197 RepID=S8C4L6_DACHA|nr:hypothetical protein H072_3426 [Dactylellina haptotyla CBS 200.50]